MGITALYHPEAEAGRHYCICYTVLQLGSLFLSPTRSAFLGQLCDLVFIEPATEEVRARPGLTEQTENDLLLVMMLF